MESKVRGNGKIATLHGRASVFRGGCVLSGPSGTGHSALMSAGDQIPAPELPDHLARCPGWSLEGKEIVHTFSFESFPEAIRFVDRVAELAEKACHHPDIDIRYSRVTLRLTTHSRGGLTVADFDLASEIDKLAG